MRKIIVFICTMSIICGLYAEEINATAKAECTKLDNSYMSMKRDYTEAKKKLEQAKKSKVKSMHDYTVAVTKEYVKVVDLEKKFSDLPATTPESKQLKAKLLQQLRLGRELKPDEVAALTKSAK